MIPSMPVDKKRLELGHIVVEIFESYHLSTDDFSDDEINHFIDLLQVANRDLAISIICGACLQRLAYNV